VNASKLLLDHQLAASKPFSNTSDFEKKGLSETSMIGASNMQPVVASMANS
jgi:hypothetical protein